MPDVYKALALKYRPSKFSEVVSQKVPVRILRNTLKTKKIYPSLVFYGSAGSGKTSMARIYAKGLNCSSFEEDVCGVCDSCKAITAGGSLAYIEQDAASNGNVDDVQELLKVLRYEVPGVAYRVVTLDECHMMSQAAWNSMLKVIEEPPPHVVFIFVTTEVRKVPETIMSRSFALPFKSIGSEDVGGQLTKIAEQEGIKVGPEVFEAIARRSAGKMRDAITLLEQLWVLSDGKEVDEDTMALVGVCGQDVYARFLNLMLAGKIKDGVDLFRHWLVSMGPTDFLKGLEDYLHKLFLHQNGIKVQVVQPDSKVTWSDLIECISNVWEMQDVTRSHYSQPRVENMLARMFLRYGGARDTEPVEKNPPPPQATEPAHPLLHGNGNGNGKNKQLEGKPEVVQINSLADFQKLWR